MSATVETVETAGLSTDVFAKRKARVASRALLISALTLIILVGFGLRAAHLGAEGLSEDELNKLSAVEDYRAHGLTSANGEHPMLMKALLTASIVAAERWNATSFVSSNSSLRVSTESALRLPSALFGAFTSLLIFLVVSELFGTEIAFIAAALWAIDPTGISFNRIAKEDTFLLFFFLLANAIWLRGQRVAEEGLRRPEPYYWATAAAFGAMLASKYMPHFFAISVSYYHIFQGVPATRWRMGKRKWLIFFVVMGATFLLCNPAILLPGTWHEMKIFAGEHRIGHDSYEFMGALYRNQVTLWLKGMPWYFYYVFMGVKISLPVLAAFVVGLPLLFRRKLGDGRFLILFWLLFWFMPFTVLGGKFTRYFTLALPVVLITAAVGIHFVGQKLSNLIAKFYDGEALKAAVKTYGRVAVSVIILIFPAVASASVAPHYRLYTNLLGGGWARAGSYFPHDEFYDASARDAANEIAARARNGARVASETPGLVAYYAKLAGRSDLICVSLSDGEAVRQLVAGDFVIVARGRRYFSNDRFVAQLEHDSQPVATVSLGQTPSVRIFELNTDSQKIVDEESK